jgi:hypothetical protein
MSVFRIPGQFGSSPRHEWPSSRKNQSDSQSVCQEQRWSYQSLLAAKEPLQSLWPS